MRPLPLLAGVLLIASTACTLHPTPIATSLAAGSTLASRGAALEEYLGRATAFGFSGAVFVSDRGTPIVFGGYGLANRAIRAPVTVHTPFYVASLTKQFVATAIMRLAEQGRLSVNDSVARFFVHVPPDKAGITLHHLLTHTSGLAPRVPEDGGLTRDAFVAAILAAPARSRPGERYAYSNAGYGVLAAVIERVTGLPIARALDTLLFAPAGMHETVLAIDTLRAATARAAHVYRGALDQGDAAVSHHRRGGWVEMSGVGVVTTLADAAIWEHALRTGRVIGRETQERMRVTALEHYGAGWVVEPTDRGTTLQWHTGLLLPEGWNAQYRRYLEDDVTMIVLSNAYREDALGDVVARQLQRSVFGGSVAMPPRTLDTRADWPASGTYVNAAGARFRLVSGDGAASIEPLDQHAVNLLRFVRLADTARFDAETRRAAGAIAAIWHDSLSTISGLLSTSRPFAVWREQLSATTRALTSRFGVPLSIETLYTIANVDDSTLLATYARIEFPGGARLMRYNWSGGLLVGASDLGSFVGAAQDVELVPGSVPFVPQGDDRFATYDLVTDVSTFWRTWRDADGEHLELVLRDGRTTFTRTP